MGWFNYYGLAIICLMMAPNALYAAKCKDRFQNLWQNRLVETLEQIGRFGCFGLMIVNIPGTWLGFWFDGALAVYIATNAALLAAYLAIWAVCFYKNNVFRALALSILPSVSFLFSGVMLRSVPLIAAAAIFAPCHIIISYQNAVRANAGKSRA